jgi:eukaryotic-like serine/threonine-protein kinase
MVSLKAINFDALVGRTVGNCVLLRKLGQGAMSVVFVAYQRNLQRQIAVKILPKAILTPQMAEMFQQEAAAAAFLSHPCIITVHEIGETDEFLYFTMQLVKGKPLTYYLRQAVKKVLPSKRCLPVQPSLKIIVRILDALEYANGLGIVHRDVKPGNILIESHSQRPMLSDFGVARSYSSRSDTSRLLAGTPTYMAPEQIVSPIVDGRADVYAAGVTLFEMVTGRLPYPPYDSALKLLKIKLRLQDRLFQKKPSEVNPAVDGDLDRIILTAVAYDKERRFATCGQFARAIDHYLESASHSIATRALTQAAEDESVPHE